MHNFLKSLGIELCLGSKSNSRMIKNFTRVKNVGTFLGQVNIKVKVTIYIKIVMILKKIKACHQTVYTRVYFYYLGGIICVLLGGNGAVFYIIRGCSM